MRLAHWRRQIGGTVFSCLRNILIGQAQTVGNLGKKYKKVDTKAVRSTVKIKIYEHKDRVCCSWDSHETEGRYWDQFLRRVAEDRTGCQVPSSEPQFRDKYG